jgi:hypothetical protein
VEKYQKEEGAMNLVHGDIQISDEYAEELAREHDVLYRRKQAAGDDTPAGAELRGFNQGLFRCGVLPAVRRARERLGLNKKEDE